MSEELYTLVIDGKEIQAPANSSIIQALAHAGKAITANVGCMGQGVCGSCRCLVRNEGERKAETKLAAKPKLSRGCR